MKGALIQISLAGIEDAAYRRRLQAISTSLTVSDADVDLLVAEGKTMVQNDPTLLGLIANLDAEPSQSPTQAACQSLGGGSRRADPGGYSQNASTIVLFSPSKRLRRFGLII